MAQTLRLLTHEVTLDAPAELPVELLAPVADQSAIPVLRRTEYEVVPGDGGVVLVEDGAVFAVVPSLDDAVPALDRRIRVRVLDLAAHSGWLPLSAGQAVAGESASLLVGDGVEGTTLVRAATAISYPGPEWRTEVRPRPVTGIALLTGAPPHDAELSQAVTAALLAARIDTGVRAAGADVREIAALLRAAGGSVVTAPDEVTGVLALRARR